MDNERKNRNLKIVLWRMFQALLLITGVTLLCFGIALIFVAPNIIDSKIREQKKLVEGTISYRLWKDPDYTLRSDIYVYSINNPDQILNGSKPEVSTIGPYSYQVEQKKRILGSGNGTIKYQYIRDFIFDQNASCAKCSLSRKVWIPNIIFQKFVEVASDPITSVAQSALSSQTPFLEISVENILFKGYKDPYFEEVCTIPFVDFLCESILDFPEKIGFLMDRNGTQKVFVASTGEFDNGETIGKIIKWDERKLLPEEWWHSTQARLINGTDGGLYKPNIKKTDRIEIFVPELCRSIYLTFADEFNYRGIPAYRFTAKEDLLDPEISGNEGFCHKNGKSFFSDGEKCLPKGLLDLSHCYKGLPPIVFSFPNFLFASEKVKKSVVGLNDSSVTHDGIIVDIEPHTGTLLRGYRRSQINIAMWKGHGINYRAKLSKMRNSIVPLLAEYQFVGIGDGSLKVLQQSLIRVKKAFMLLSLFSIIVGVFLISAAMLSELLLKAKLMKRLIKSDSKKVITRITVQPVPNNLKDVTFRSDSKEAPS